MVIALAQQQGCKVHALSVLYGGKNTGLFCYFCRHQCLG
ncbi:MAG: hypothetical protein EBQ82_00605 [Betaproteobacteria bacterium]|nr:hypothetical protein [Betaproteobacteria bacterium]NBY03913.1 hypothetical protein [Betaproteobacteria bacterium]